MRREHLLWALVSSRPLRTAILAAAAGAAALAGCKKSAPDDLFVAEQTTAALVFIKSQDAETLNRSWAESNLYKLSPISPDGIVTAVTNFVGASVSDPCVSFDGKTILFALRPPGATWKNIWEINADGSGLRQITRGGGHDFDPLYLPDGQILFTSSRDSEMDEYNHSLAEHLYRCNADGSNLERISFNQSNDFDPTLLPDGRVMYTRWEHFGTMNRFPLFATNPDGSGTFHHFGPHERNFFHAQPTPDGRIVAIESTMVEGDAGPLAVLKPEQGPADPATGSTSLHWDALNANINTDGAPWVYGAFKYPFPLGGNKFVASYTLPAATEEDADYGLYTFTLEQTGAGTTADPATIAIKDLTFLYNDPAANEFDAQVLAAHPKPPVIQSTVDPTKNYGVFLAQDVFNRGTNDGQERPVKGTQPIDRIAVYTARATRPGDMNDFSANEFEKRALIGFAPVYADGSFRIKVPADTPIGFATLDEYGRGIVVKRTWIYLRPGEEFNKCVGCHEDRAAGGPVPTNLNPIAATMPPTDLDLDSSQFQIINYETNIGPIVQSKCATCHYPTYVQRDSTIVNGTDTTHVAVTDTIPAPGNLDLTAVPDTTMRENRIFPRGYINLSGETRRMDHNVVEPAFPRRSLLIDYLKGLGTQQGKAVHPQGQYALTPAEVELFNLWVLLGAQYK